MLWNTFRAPQAVTGSQLIRGNLRLPNEDLTLVAPPTRERRRVFYLELNAQKNPTLRSKP